MFPSCGYTKQQGRDITTADFELLLTLDTSATLALHEHLLRALPLQNQGIDRPQNEEGMGLIDKDIIHPA